MSRDPNRFSITRELTKLARFGGAIALSTLAFAGSSQAVTQPRVQTEVNKLATRLKNIKGTTRFEGKDLNNKWQPSELSTVAILKKNAAGQPTGYYFFQKEEVDQDQQIDYLTLKEETIDAAEGTTDEASVTFLQDQDGRWKIVGSSLDDGVSTSRNWSTDQLNIIGTRANDIISAAIHGKEPSPSSLHID